MEVAVGIVAQRGNERAQELAATLIAALERDARAGTVVVDDATGEVIDAPSSPVADMDDRDLVVSIGGDGTLLFVAREVGPTAILGINLGEVGFLNAVEPADAVDVVTDCVETVHDDGSLEGRELVRLEATGVDVDLTLEPAVNEILVYGPRRGPGGGATVEVRVGGDRYAESHADGALVATPAGSTAYNLSEGGPFVHPSADALVVTQMAAADGMPSLVVGPDTDLELSVSDADVAYAISDGRARQRLEPPVTITVSVADDPITLVGPGASFVGSLGKLD